MTVGQKIRAFRKQRGLTQERLGALCGVSSGAISSYENGVTLPKRRAVEKIARALDVPPEKLLEEAPAPVLPASREQASDTLLYDGVLAALKELYGMVEGRIVMGENGASRKYYVVKRLSDSFVLYERDIAAIVRAAKASMTPLVEHMRKGRSA